VVAMSHSRRDFMACALRVHGSSMVT